MIDFVLFIGILIVRKCQKTAVKFEVFLIVQLTFFQLLTLFLAPKSQPKKFCFWTLQFEIDGFVPCIAILVVQYKAHIILFLTNFHVQVHLFSKIQA